MPINRIMWSKVPKEEKGLFWIFIGLAIVIFIIATLGVFKIVLSSSDEIGFMSGLIAGIFGILIGFQLNRIGDKEKEEKTKSIFLKSIHQELLQIRKLTPTDISDTGHFYTFYTDIWDSIVSSGNLCLLDSDQAIKLSNVYKFIKATSIEAEYFRRAWEEYQSIPDTEINKKQNFVGKKLDELGVAQMKRLSNLRGAIDDVLKEKWWN